MLSEWPLKTELDVHDVQCNMEMMTIPMILEMKTSNVGITTTVHLHELHEIFCSTQS